MSVLRSIEHRIESLVEGVFGRAFRSNVQPVELARKLAKEMDEHRTVSISRVYVPNEYALYLSPSDRKQFASYEESLLTELGDYLSEHARREGYSLLATPKVLLEEDDDLEVGEFGIATRLVQPQREQRSAPAEEGAAAAGAAAGAMAPSATKVFKPPAAATASVSAQEAQELGLAHEARARLRVNGKTYDLSHDVVVLGRSRECDITLDDANVSRRHAEIRRENAHWTVVDLGSTNGIEVNGKRTDRARLENDDRILLGRTEVTFELK
jgi:FhaA, N-terminal domain/FHA domain